MLTQDQIELIHREIDGANDPEQSAAFTSLVEDHPDARALARELRHLTRLFDRVGTAEPPGHLRRAILDALPRQAPVSSRWGVLRDAVRFIGAGFLKRPRFALVSALCVGAVTGFGVYAVLAGTVTIDRSNAGGLAGTIVAPRVARGLEMVQDVPIGVDGVNGRVSVMTGPTAVVVELESEAAQVVEVRLTFPEGAYGLRGFSQLRNEAGASLTAKPGFVHVTTSGANTQTFVLSHAGPVSPLALSIFAGGEQVFATTLLARGPDRVEDSVRE